MTKIDPEAYIKHMLLSDGSMDPRATRVMFDFLSFISLVTLSQVCENNKKTMHMVVDTWQATALRKINEEIKAYASEKGSLKSKIMEQVMRKKLPDIEDLRVKMTQYVQAVSTSVKEGIGEPDQDEEEKGLDSDEL